MLGVLRTAVPQQHSTSDTSRVKFRTVLGLGPLNKGFEPSRPKSSTSSKTQSRSLSRRSVDVVSGYSLKRQHRRNRSSVVDPSFYVPDEPVPAEPTAPTSEMKNSVSQSVPTQRVPVRAEKQDGPWAVSVAETPHEPNSYSIYIKTPTHNITLTRTALEIFEMHGKLRETHPGYKMPSLPIDAASIPHPPKRKSAFLNTLSRLASPASKAGQRSASGRHTSSSASSALPTPLASPKHEIHDPFSEADDEDDLQPPIPPANGTVTALAAYLTNLSNDPILRQSRVWKRFNRVRTDDLQSVRAERAIKRVRSDIAAHVSPGNSADGHQTISQVVNGDDETPPTNGVNGAETKASVQGDITEEDEGETGSTPPTETPVEDSPEVEKVVDGAEDGAEAEQDRAQTPRSPKPSSATADMTMDGTDVGDDAEAPSTPQAQDGPVHRIPRSQSAEPVSRASRVYLASPLGSEAASSRTSQTGESADDSSISTTGRTSARKKRSKSMDPNTVGKKSQRKVVIDDFEMMRVLGKGCAGKVLLVRHKPTQDVFALKAITKRHVLAHQELQHTLTEQAVLKRMAAEGSDPFVVKLWWSFHDKENLFLVMDFHPGGDLATQLARWGRLGRDRARFYAAEIVEGVEGLHAAGVIYRDLKPENILIAADGHIVLTDFGLSKEFPRRNAPLTAPPTPSGFRGDFTAGTPTPATPHWMKNEGKDWAPPAQVDTTSTFCGTAEYLAPEVIQGQPYSYEVDWWSFGTMLYEMLTGITPFWANNHSDMYYRVLQDELQFPEDRTMDQDTKSLIRGLLQRNPALRMKEPRIKKHPYFSMIDWSHVYYKRYIPPYIPPIDPSNASDTQNFDDTFLDMEPVIKDEEEQTDTDQEGQTDAAERTDGEDGAITPSQSRSPSVHPKEDGVDVFDGYSFKGRHSIIMDDEEEEEEEEEEGEEEDEVSITGPSVDMLLDAQGPEVTPVVAVVSDQTVADEGSNPKTPEARPAALPDTLAPPPSPSREQAVAAAKKAVSRRSHEVQISEAAKAEAATADEAKAAKAAAKRQSVQRQRGRREKSGIPALDRDLSDAHDEDTEREEDDDWDFVEADVNVEERNGAKGTSLFARGVVDRYKLAVFRKSTPRRSGGPRSFSGMSTESDLASPEGASPTPSDKQRRGRTAGLTFRKHPRQFLRQRSPQASSRASPSTKTLSPSNSATLSAASTTSTGGLLTPSPSGGSTVPGTPSLRSKESAISMGSPGDSSDPSIDEANHLGDHTIRGNSAVDEDKQKSKVLKKYKEAGEKVLSIFQSPR
ncbi:hypothetical protein DAEQUDRAFT_733128 [Daedalea quercina L-15889]|uniref:Kinase-like protein n=1 Tax=Daedalea quercina L-15889 TaxID=1314783 RepID=A0A165L7Z9_9APHY|nr:hypothetical protein DAEQUDRAFT_733128 [Daedalea quercina L-15889]